MIKAGKYTKTAFMKELGISRHVWLNRYDELMAHLRDFLDFDIEEVDDKGHLLIHVNEVYDEDIPLLPRKSQREAKERDYKDFTLAFLPEHPYNTVMNLARNAIDVKNKYNHSDKSATNYIRPIIHGDSVVLGERKWMRLTEDKMGYAPVTEEQDAFLRAVFKKNFDGDREIENAISARKAGDISKSEANKRICKAADDIYENSIGAFIERYGFRPIKVACMEVCTEDVKKEA